MVLTLQEVLNQRDDNVFKAASLFAGGIGSMHDTCGALLGSCMMISLKYGRSPGEVGKSDDIGNKDKYVNALIQVGKFYKWFEREFGSTRCCDIRARLLGVFYDSKVPWQQELAEEAGLRDKCSVLLSKTAARAAEILWDDNE